MKDAVQALRAQVATFRSTEQMMLQLGFRLKRTDDLNRWADLPDPYQLHWYLMEGNVTINFNQKEVMGCWITWLGATNVWRLTVKTNAPMSNDPFGLFVQDLLVFLHANSSMEDRTRCAINATQIKLFMSQLHAQLFRPLAA